MKVMLGTFVYVFRYFIYLALETFSLVDKRDLFIDEKYFSIKPYYGLACLDVGCGYGDFSNFLSEEGHVTTAIDVIDRNQHKNVPTTLFDGTSVPFDDNSFDTVTVMFVLHHSEQQITLLKEVARVAKNYVIVAEDTIESPLDSILSYFHIRSTKWAKGINSFHSNCDWLEIFKAHALKVVTAVRIPRYKEPIYPVSRVIYVLAPETSGSDPIPPP